MASTEVFTNSKKLIISRILHAGYIFECQEQRILFDPIFENPFSINCYAYPPVTFSIDKIKSEKFSAIFISHFHEDHCSLESLILLDKQTPVYIFCKSDELLKLIGELGFSKVYSLNWDQTISIGEFQIIVRKALDEDIDSLFHIKVAGYNILNVVDSWIPQETMKQLSSPEISWDLVLWPFQTMRELEVIAPSRFKASDRQLPTEWLDQLKQLNPRRVVPSSCQFQMEDWSWYNKSFFPISYQIFEKEIKNLLPEAKVIRMDPGVSFEMVSGNMKSGEPLSWVISLVDQEFDYIYENEVLPTPIGQIAENLNPVTERQRKRVLDFCSQEIQLCWKNLDVEDDDYFNNDKSWCLKVYDRKDQVYEFHYQFSHSQMSLSSSKNTDVGWLTEIPMSKLYGALECGESLTSIYIRINDTCFSRAIEEAIQDVDILADPLLRCLYNQQPFAYQKAQLKKIKHSKESFDK